MSPRWMLVAAYILTIPIANWMITHVGQCIANGPCVIPVGFGLTAPSGVLVVGATLVIRNMVQEFLGRPVAVAAILTGASLSLLIAAPGLAVASATAFLLSEFADMTVYTPLRRKRLYSAMLLSGLAGAIVDSAVFLWLAFGSLDFIAGQVVGKLWMTLAALPVIRLRMLLTTRQG